MSNTKTYSQFKVSTAKCISTCNLCNTISSPPISFALSAKYAVGFSHSDRIKKKMEAVLCSLV